MLSIYVSEMFSYLNIVLSRACADPENYVRGSPTLTTFFFSEGREDQNTTISGQSVAFPWRSDNGPTLVDL